MTMDTSLVEANLLAVLTEVGGQPEVGVNFPAELQSLAEQIQQIREYVEDAGEYGIAYESLVTLLESFPFRISGPAAVKLLELGLLMRFKTERSGDARFDFR